MKRTMLVLLLGLPVGAQDAAMSLNDAVHLALDKNKSIEASNAAKKGADTRIAEARSGRLPKVNYSESWARSDNPVFVFSSLLTQNQFGTQNF
jgi:outer membrane protein